MKKIEAIIKPFKLDDVKEALQEIGLQGITRCRPDGAHRRWKDFRAPCRGCHPHPHRRARAERYLIFEFVTTKGLPQ
jgi:hypothetical protein